MTNEIRMHAYHLEQHQHHQLMMHQLRHPSEQQNLLAGPGNSSTSPSPSPQLMQPNHIQYTHNNLSSRNNHLRTNETTPKKLAAKLCPQTTTCAATGAARPAHLFRYHPYSSQAPTVMQPQPYPPTFVRPSGPRHNHHHQFIVGADHVYPPTALGSPVLYGSPNHSNGHHRNDQFNRMQATIADDTSDSRSCRHIKPCSCYLVPVVEPLKATQPNNHQLPSMGQQVNTTNRCIRHSRSPAGCSNSNSNSIAASAVSDSNIERQ